MIARDTAQCEMAAEMLRSFGELRLRVTGTSMLPSVRPGDVLRVVAAKPEDVRRGEIVLFERDGRLFAHRVVESGARLITRGDRHRHDDPPVEARELLGRVSAVLREGRAVPLEAGLWGRIGAAMLRRSDFCARILMRAASIPAALGAKRRVSS